MSRFLVVRNCSYFVENIIDFYFNNIIRFVTTKVPFNKLNVIVTKAKRGKFADGNKCNHHRKAPEVEKL